MCDIFPEVDNCCYFINLRLGMLFIAVVSIMTGCATLTCVEKVTDLNKAKAEAAASKLTNITAMDYKQFKKVIMANFGQHILNLIFTMSVLFMVAGVILLFATLTDEEGLVQVFVWLEFLGVVLGYVAMISVTYDCMTKPTCLLDMDWLSMAFCITFWFFFMVAWIYFISVANSYVLNGDSE